MKKIFITGATSFIGLNLIQKLIFNKENKLFLFYRKNTLKKSLLDGFNANKIELNLEDFEKLNDLIDNNCDIFYHFAWGGTRGADRNDSTIQENNYLNSIKVLKMAKRLNTKVFVFAGSQAEYGVLDELITEETKCIPDTEYGKYKLKFSLYAEEFCKKNKITYIEPRFFSLYGENDNPKTLIMYALNNLITNKQVLLNNGNQKWNYLYIKDAIDALIALSDNKKNGVYNFASNDTRKLKDYIIEMKNILNSKSEVVSLDSNTSEVNLNPSIKKLENTINWEPKTSFRNGIESILNKKEG